jgi:hypothetical protein
MADIPDRLEFRLGAETEPLVNFIFRQLPDDLVDQIELDRIVPSGDGIARELVTTAAVLTFTSALAVPILRLVERYMEQTRQQTATQLIYQAAKDNPDALKILADLEAKHAELMVKRDSVVSSLLKPRKAP